MTHWAELVTPADARRVAANCDIECSKFRADGGAEHRHHGGGYADPITAAGGRRRLAARARAQAAAPARAAAHGGGAPLRFLSRPLPSRGLALMGSINKFMDAVGVDLEEASVQEVSTILLPTGWTPGKHRVAAETTADPAFQARAGGPDTLAPKLALLRHVPAALRLEGSWTRGGPSPWPAVGKYLAAQTGHDFPLLAKVASPRAVKAIATVLRDNLKPSDSRLGLGVKALCGLVYASVVGNESLAREARQLVLLADPH